MRPRVLLVDDDDALRRTMARTLARDFEVVQASGGVAAIERLRTETFDAVVTDLEMPGTGGDDVYAWIEANRPRLAGRVVIFTGGAATSKRAGFLGSFDPRRVVDKPSALDAMLDALRFALGKR